jgi:hypothetical protein
VAVNGEQAPAALLSPRERLFVPLAAAAYVTLAFLTDPSMFRATDFVKDWLPNRIYQLSRLRAGELPLWNPYVGLGRPFLAAIDTSTFYPSTLVNMVLGLYAGAALLTIAHFALAALALVALAAELGMARPLRWLAAAAFLGCSHVLMILMAGAVQYAWGACYLPLAFLLGTRLQDRPSLQRVALLALTLALQLLAGYPQIAWITWLGLGAFLLGRGLGPAPRHALIGLASMAAALLWAFALAGVQLMPLFELVAQSNRAQPTVADAAAGSLPWRMWLSLAIPADAVSGIPFLVALFVGAPTVLAGLTGLVRWEDRNVRGLALASTLAFLVAAGKHTPAFAALFHVVPGLSSFHFPGRTTIVLMVALPLAGGLFLSAPAAPRRSFVVLGAATAAALLGTAWWWLRVTPPQARSGSWLAIRCAVILTSAAAIALAQARTAPPARRWAVAALFALTMAELGMATVKIKRLAGLPGPFVAEAAIADALRSQGLYDAAGVPPRIAVPYPIVRDNSGLIHGYSSVSFYAPLGLGRVWGYMHEVLGIPLPTDQNEFPSADIYQHGPFPYNSMGIVLGWDPGTGQLRLNRQPDPRAYVTGVARDVADWREAVRRMREGHDFHRVALLEGASPALDGAGGGARIVRFEPERVEVSVDSGGRALLLLAEAWYPGWGATVNGADAPVLPANAWMRAVPVPAGHSRVVLSYRSRFLLAGAAVSFVSLAALVAVLVSGRPRTPAA